MDEKPWDAVDFKWDERPGLGSGEPTALDLVWNMKSWEVIADKGKETLHIRGFLCLYWTDERIRGYPTRTKGKVPPENIWRPLSIFQRVLDFLSGRNATTQRNEVFKLLPLI